MGLALRASVAPEEHLHGADVAHEEAEGHVGAGVAQHVLSPPLAPSRCKRACAGLFVYVFVCVCVCVCTCVRVCVRVYVCIR